MLTDATATAPSARRRTGRTHDDAPDTKEAAAHLATLDGGPEYDLLCEEIVTAWLPMANRLAGRFRNKGENLEDLRQVAAMGLIKAVNRYEPERGAFESYAVPTITGELRRHFRDRMWDVRVPRRVQDLRNKVRVARRDLMDQPGHDAEPSAAELAEHTGLTEAEVHDGLEALTSYRALSLDAEITADPDGFSLADTLGTSDPAYDFITDREAAKDGLRRLPERERTILYLRFFEDMTQSKIAEELGISQMHVSRLISNSCARVRAEAVRGDESTEHDTGHARAA
ncbi:RNA polymerase sigma factor [Streptomyces longisporoflavus]|uniref:SigB/SigF/SigG family RNA polymerase sigma factor n=1 Tax=Streptomyces longisporoflavus TaxID=28044 RepID=UPI00167D116F|nr:SigB/SigF/SigG family RNA polymerase sigma factor [Streptomyces longisporoflavus]GGV23010.1 RNA polymerase sigma factor [Streptomyces longisporoflavus]